MHVKLNELRGRKVFDANGREIGRVKAALVDMETWLDDTLQIRVARHAACRLTTAPAPGVSDSPSHHRRAGP